MSNLLHYLLGWRSMGIQELSQEDGEIETIAPIGCEDLASEEDQNTEEIPEHMIGMSFDLEDEVRDYYVAMQK